MSILDVAFGRAVEVTGLDELPGGWLKMYVNARWRGQYVLITPEGADETRRQWQSSIAGHLFITLDALTSAEIFCDADEIAGLA